MRRALLALAFLIVAAPGRALGDRTAAGAPVPPRTALAWAAMIDAHFQAPSSDDPAAFRDVLGALSALDLRNEAVRASVEPVALRLQAAAEAVLAAQSPRLDQLAALARASAYLPLAAPQQARLAELVDARVRAIAARLTEPPAAADAADPVISVAVNPPTNADSRVFVLYVVQEKGKRDSGKDQSAELKALAERYPGKVRILDRDGGSMFMSVSGLEIAPSVRDDVLREVRAIEGLGAVPLAELAAAGLGRGDALAAHDLSEIKERLEYGPLVDRLRALSDLTARLNASTPAMIAAIPEAQRDEAHRGLLQLANTLVSAFEMIRQSDDNAIRRREYEARKETEELDYGKLSRIAESTLAEPAMRARFGPLREILMRVLSARDRLDTRESVEHMLNDTKEARHAGLEFIAADPRRRLKYAKAWTELVSGSVAETMFGLRSGFSRDDKWSGSGRSGGYEHIEGRRQSTFLYEWRPWRVSPGDLRSEAQLLLGIPGMTGAIVDMAVQALEKVQADVANLDAANRASHVARKMKEWEAQAGPNIAKAAEEGKPIDPAIIERMREYAREQADEEYDRYYQVDSHGVVDSFISSLYYAPYYAYTVPGFKEAVYLASVMTVFQRALDRVTELGMVKQLVDSGVSFLAGIKDAPVLDERPELRAQAGALWAQLSRTVEARGIKLVTRLDGVIDRRPEVRPAPPRLMEQDADKYATTWQAAERADGKYVARAGGDRVILVWERATGKLVKRVKLEDARQHYGDLDNSLGVAFDRRGRLVVATLHDRDKEQGGGSFQRIRVYDMDDPKLELLPGDELSKADLEGVHILREMPQTSAGMLAVAETRRYTPDGSFNRWSGSDIGLFSMTGPKLGQIDDFMLLGTRGDLVLGARTHFQNPGFGLFDVADPAKPKDITPSWLTAWAESWSRRNERSEYGYWPSLRARLATANGRAAIVIEDRGKLLVFDLSSGAPVREIALPERWRAAAHATDAKGTRVAAIVQAPGSLHPRPQRLIVWDLSTGEIVVEREVSERGEVFFTRDGRELVLYGKGRVELAALP